MPSRPWSPLSSSSTKLSWLRLGLLSNLLLLLPYADAAAVNSLTLSKSCYQLHEAIPVTFSVANPKVGDWVGIQSSTAPAGASFDEFLYTCGTFTCSGSQPSGTVTFPNNKMTVGTYKAVLFPNNTFTPLVSSSVFSIKASCSGGGTTPTSKPIFKPTMKPTTKAPTAPTSINVTAAKIALQQASVQIQAMVKSDPFWLQQLLRLMFHDCHGGVCDGCVDVTDIGNRQLDNPINAFQPIVNQFATPQTGLSRADIWTQAMYIALNNANQRPRATPLNFEMRWIGRKDCEKRNPNMVCKNSVTGQVVPCGPMSGPQHAMASVNMDSLDFANFWKTNFPSVTLRQAMALMGCHTVGMSFSQDSGINGPNGWDSDNLAFNNGYFRALLGNQATTNMTLAQLVQVAPSWVKTSQDNPGTVFGTRHFWTMQSGGKRIIMTNADMAGVRMMDMNHTTGQVGCAYAKSQAGQSNVCPAASTLQFAQEFLDNEVWMQTVKDALEVMTTNGYNRASPCPSGQICVLS